MGGGFFHWVTVLQLKKEGYAMKPYACDPEVVKVRDHEWIGLRAFRDAGPLPKRKIVFNRKAKRMRRRNDKYHLRIVMIRGET